MRLTKMMYVIDESETEIIDWTPLGQPIYGDMVILYHPIPCEIEPFSAGLAEYRYGVFADITHRAFTEPSDYLTLLESVRYDGEDNYKITQVMRYDKHFEVLIKKG
ncbi:hypothetical protein [Paraliobacillus sp. X-1268]|uniref:hypothetical protein n=1 Tax=Paraliobacillus sp. X-1268 TaxID=2213193 RepID=UPI000E3DA426|nr:hypothetical protein [Paraliobacillus sp. X-1268]